MTLHDHQVHGWIASLVDRTADQLRAELALLVRRVQDAPPPHEVGLADGPGVVCWPRIVLPTTG